MKQQLEKFDNWLRHPVPFRGARAVLIILILLAIGTIGIAVILNTP